MNATDPNSGEWLASLRRLGESASALLRTRFELWTVEWQEEKLRLLDLLAWLALAAAIGLSGIFAAVLTLALWLWSTAGYAGLIGLTVAALAGALALFWRIRRRIQTGPTPFRHTAAELRKDGECFRGND